MIRLFKSHPQEVGESYVEHLGQASSFGWCMIINGFACLVHGVFPFIFKKTGSEAITALHDRMVTHRCRPSQSDEGLVSETC